jgi:hypothetical protein
VVRLSALRADRSSSPRRSLVLFSVRSWADHRGHSAAERITSTEKSADLIGNLPACGIVLQPITLPRAPNFSVRAACPTHHPNNTLRGPLIMQRLIMAVAYSLPTACKYSPQQPSALSSESSSNLLIHCPMKCLGSFFMYRLQNKASSRRDNKKPYTWRPTVSFHFLLGHTIRRYQYLDSTARLINGLGMFSKEAVVT